MTHIVQVVGYAVTLLLLALVVAKVIWNLAIPYGMLRMKEPKPISCFPIIEIVPLALAVLVAWTFGLDGQFSASRIGIVGAGVVVVSYVHFCIVAFIGGLIQRYVPPAKGKQDDK